MTARNQNATLFDAAVAHQTAGRMAEALILFDALAREHPEVAQLHVSRGAVLQALARYDEAIAAFDAALALAPRSLDAQLGKSSVLLRLNRPDEALASSDRAVEVAPRSALAHNNRAIALKELCRLQDAVASYDQAIALMPQLAELYWGKALSLLLLGRFEEGWPLYEWRKRVAALKPASRPVWFGGQSLMGKTLLIRAEQGLGDTIQFSRYAALARQQGAAVVLRLPDGLVRLLHDIGNGITVIGESGSIPAHDYGIDLLSMPLAFGTSAHTIPADLPYLRAETSLVAQWKSKIGQNGFRIGIAWHGGQPDSVDPQRFFSPRLFEPISRLAGVRLISLQKGDGVAQLQELPAGMRVETLDDLDAGPDAFIDTAAVMESLDLVITPDTAVAHLAGALGRPVWLALRHVPDWRWQLDRADSPWYPGMRLFRQPARGDWTGVFSAMVAELMESGLLQ